MKPKRVFQVYQHAIHSLEQNKTVNVQTWAWRLIATRNGQIVGGSQEAFDSRGNAIRAAKREASLYQEGVAVVEVAAC